MTLAGSSPSTGPCYMIRVPIHSRAPTWAHRNLVSLSANPSRACLTLQSPVLPLQPQGFRRCFRRESDTQPSTRKLQDLHEEGTVLAHQVCPSSPYLGWKWVPDTELVWGHSFFLSCTDALKCGVLGICGMQFGASAPNSEKVSVKNSRPFSS